MRRPALPQSQDPTATADATATRPEAYWSQAPSALLQTLASSSDGLAQRAAVGAAHQRGDAKNDGEQARQLPVPGVRGVAGHAHDHGHENHADEGDEHARLRAQQLVAWLQAVLARQRVRKEQVSP